MSERSFEIKNKEIQKSLACGIRPLPGCYIGNIIMLGWPGDFYGYCT